MLGDWTLYDLYRGRYAQEAATKAMTNVGWDELQGFVVVDAQERFVGSEIVRPAGHAASELLRRLWVSYSMESAQRAFAGGADAFAAPSDDLARVMQRLADDGGTFQRPLGVEQPAGARVSQLEVVVAGVRLHALEVAESPAFVSVLAGTP
jgi:hypothetical protein